MKLAILIVANALLRIAGGASGILVGLFLSDSASTGTPIDAGIVGLIGAMSFAAELLGSLPMGVLSDAVTPRWLMTSGALLGGLATQLFGITGSTGIFLLSRGLEGLGAAAGGPALLAHLTDATEGNPNLRARAMSFYELSFLAGLALGGLLGSQLWRALHAAAFAAVAGVYALCAVLMFIASGGSKPFGAAAALTGLGRAFRDPFLRRLAPVWLCMNAIVGLWLGPTLTFLLTQPAQNGQFLSGVFAVDPSRVGWMLLWYASIFGAGVSVWSVLIPRLGAERALRIGLVAMPAVCLGFFAFNHSPAGLRWPIGVTTAVLIMVESGFTPAALSLLAGVVGAHSGRGAAMGIYSVLLSIGAIIGSLLAAVLGKQFSVDGLIYGTVGLALVALLLSRKLRSQKETWR